MISFAKLFFAVKALKLEKMLLQTRDCDNQIDTLLELSIRNNLMTTSHATVLLCSSSFQLYSILHCYKILRGESSEGWILVLIASIPGLCILFTYSMLGT